jgi:hypothetical protein
MKHPLLPRALTFAAAVALAAILAVGCRDAQSPQDKAMAEWIGAPSVAVIQGWGEPDKVFTDGRSGFVVCYVNRTDFVHYNVLFNDAPTDGSIVPAKTLAKADKIFEQANIDEYRNYRVFYLEPDGTVYDWKWRGKQE